MSTTQAIIASMALGTAQSLASNSAAQKAAKQQYAAQMAERNQRLIIQERQRKEQLRQAEATQRARAGARGVGGTGGSTDALLTGMAVRSARDMAGTRSLLDVQDQQMKTSLANSARQNLLNTAFGTAQDVLGLFRK